ncbi:hypothetical protein [Sediminibacillus massiliensis]|uniref:hypothetical protein n=1 Tax=Sediminibacillus massiliensis TaxID=1926277 RepID=UPI0015C2DE94|nr:hypothetical protein [Sediminibacillus massiliensis]
MGFPTILFMLAVIGSAFLFRSLISMNKKMNVVLKQNEYLMRKIDECRDQYTDKRNID